MQLSRGWWKLLLSWAAAVSICVVAAGILRAIVPANQGDAAAVEQHVAPATGSPAPVLASLTEDANEAENNTQPTAAAALSDGKASLSPRANDLPNPRRVSREETKRDIAQTASSQERRLNLRVTRDSERCPKTACYKWHLISQRLQPPQYTMVELAGLRLAPGLRRKVETGNIDLLIDAVTQHRKINGHDTLIFVAINLDGVAPHDSLP